MDTLPVIYKVASGLMALFGVGSIVGGFLGYRAGSTVSLIAGGIIGILLVVCAFGVFQRPTWSLIGAIVVSLAVLGRFAPKLISNLGNLGEFTQSVGGAVTLGMVVGAVAVVLVSILCLVSGQPSAT